MNILIVNDDGILEPGLKVLAEQLAPLGDIYIVAPETHQSGQGHGITINQPLYVKDYGRLYGAKKALSVLGKPADCTRIAVGTLGVKFDLCVSGVNSGLNVGSDVLYSGTVAAATEALILGIKAIAVSGPKKSLHMAEKSIYPLVKYLLEHQALGDSYILNINYPSSKFDMFIGVKWTTQGLHHHAAKFNQNADGSYETVYELLEREEDMQSDVMAFRTGYLSITPLFENRTHSNLLQNLANQKQLNTQAIYDNIIK
ncbi:MAG: 5'/3'-nucleotidase SurE [Acholeplasma sp.]|jgi:5'-nucleotidase|nr:5'/3'-nucleotidase SurE [Acholeplasma sp.]